MKIRSVALLTVIVVLSIAGDVQSNCEPPSQNLIAWWNAEGDATDSSASGLDGTLENGATIGPGICGGAFVLDGVDDYVEVPNAVDIHSNLSGSVTFSAWFNWDGAGTAHIIRYGDSRFFDANRFLGLFVLSNGAVYWSTRVTGDVSRYAISPFPIIPGTWYHIVGVRELGVATELYVNGNLVASTDDSGVPFDLGSYAVRPLSIGTAGVGTSGGPGGFFGGAIDEVTIHDRALTAAEIEAYYLSCINHDPVADAGPDQIVECTSPAGALVTLDGAATDPDGDDLIGTWDVPDGIVLDDPSSPTPTGVFPIGVTTATLTVTDGKGGLAVDDVKITVVDSTPPEVVCTTNVAALWPARRQMVEVSVFVDATDICAAPADLQLLAVEVTSDEPDDGLDGGDIAGDVDGLDGFTAPVDITQLFEFNAAAGGFDGSVYLRAERDVLGEGRSYTIKAYVVDTANNLAETSCVVVVPHDRRKR
jgi:Concanavalin A-like lectin/glucanases superfamily